MAFTNPILAGEELNRTGIRSENYVPGSAGWRIASDGASEFDNIGVRTQLWTPSIIYNGQQISNYWEKKASGLTAWIRGYPTTSVTGSGAEAQIFATEATVVAGRAYEVFLNGVTPDISNANSTEYHIHYLLNSASAPTHANSPLMAMTLRLSQFILGSARAIYVPPSSGQLKLTATICTLDGNQVRNWCPGDGGILGVYDIGPAINQYGTVGTGAPVKVLKEWTITAKNSNTYYLRSGVYVRRSDSYQSMLIQGDWANGNGNQRAWFLFSSSDDATYVNDLMGVPKSDIVTAEVRLSNLQWYNTSPTPSGFVSLGYHPQVDNFGGNNNEPGGGVPNVAVFPTNGYAAHWFDISGSDAILDNLRSGYLAGFMIGNCPSGFSYAGIMDGAALAGGAVPPQLHMKYWK